MTTPLTAAGLFSSMRTAVIVNAIVGIALGLIALFWPGPTLLVIALLFGFALIVGGIFRIVMAFSARELTGGQRALLGVLGVLIVIAGFICLFHPGDALVVIAIMIGVGWIFFGVHDLMLGFRGTTVGPRWLSFVSGALSIIAGIIMFTLPGLTLAVFITWGAILLIIVSIVALFNLPAKATDSSKAATTSAV